MKTLPLVSIIIPTYNRAHLIGKTLDSILAQTYQKWECIVVDDGSSDKTDMMMKNYCNKDSRFKYFHRAANKLKGANACRNMGLENARGDYIIFFDSDDLMTKDHIQIKLKPLLENNYDYSIAKTKFFNVEDNSLERYYKFDKFELSAHNYIVQNINWLTLDICIKTSLAKKISFNLHLQSGQEYNYFSKLVLKSTNAVFIDEVVSLRRMHEQSVQNRLKKNNQKWKGSFLSKWYTYMEIADKLEVRTKQILLYGFIKTMYIQKRIVLTEKNFFISQLYQSYGIKANLFFPMLWSKKIFNGGYALRNSFNPDAL